MRRETALVTVLIASAASFFAGTLAGKAQPAAAPPTPTVAGGRASAVAIADPRRDEPPGPRHEPVRRRRPDREDPEAVYRVPLTAGEPMRGRADALVTIVEWTDDECPFCARVEDTLAQVDEHYGARVRRVVRMNPLPFHAHALQAAEAAMAAHAQGKFWPMHELLFANQRSLDRSSLERFAAQLGLDLQRFRTDLDEHRHRASIEDQTRAGAALGVRGTPSFFVNGRKLRGALPFERFAASIDAALVTAQAALRDRHLRPRALYDALIADGATEPVLLAGPGPTEPSAARPAPPLPEPRAQRPQEDRP